MRPKGAPTNYINEQWKCLELRLCIRIHVQCSRITHLKTGRFYVTLVGANPSFHCSAKLTANRPAILCATQRSPRPPGGTGAPLKAAPTDFQKVVVVPFRAQREQPHCWGVLRPACWRGTCWGTCQRVGTCDLRQCWSCEDRRLRCFQPTAGEWLSAAGGWQSCDACDPAAGKWLSRVVCTSEANRWRSDVARSPRSR